MTLKTRFSLSLILYTILVLSLFSGTYYFFERRAAVQSQRENQIQTVEKLRAVCRDSYVASNPITALNYVEIVRSDPAVSFASCVDSRGLILAHSDPKRTGVTLDSLEFLPLFASDRVEAREYSDQSTGAGILEWYAPVLVRGAKVGLAQVGYNQGILDAAIRLHLWRSLRQPLVAAACTFLLAVFVGVALAFSLSRPIQRLEEAARAIGEGHLDYQTSITDRTDELGSLAREMNAMAQRLKELDELKDEFIASVSHDLRNPMGAIRMYTEFILQQDPDGANLSPRIRQMLTTIMDCAARLGVFVSNILDAAKIKAGRMEYHLQPTPLAPIVQNVIRLYQIMAAQQEIQLRAEIPPELPPLLADPERLEQALANLASNALKFTRAGGSVTLAAKQAGDWAEVTVADTGKGISPAELPRLFRRFQQADVAAQKADKIHGTGLGLVIVKQSIEGMGGRVEAASELGRGTRFTLRLPLAKPLKPPLPSPQSSPQAERKEFPG